MYCHYNMHHSSQLINFATIAKLEKTFTTNKASLNAAGVRQIDRTRLRCKNNTQPAISGVANCCMLVLCDKQCLSNTILQKFI